MPKTVNIPLFEKPVSFPDSMSNEQVLEAVRRLHRERKIKVDVGLFRGPQPLPSHRSSLVDPLTPGEARDLIEPSVFRDMLDPNWMRSRAEPTVNPMDRPPEGPRAPAASRGPSFTEMMAGSMSGIPEPRQKEILGAMGEAAEVPIAPFGAMFRAGERRTRKVFPESSPWVDIPLGIGEGTAGFFEGLSTPKTIGVVGAAATAGFLVPAAAPLIAAGFAVDIATKAIEASPEALALAKEGRYQEAAAAATEIAWSLSLAGTLTKHSATGGARVGGQAWRQFRTPKPGDRLFDRPQGEGPGEMGLQPYGRQVYDQAPVYRGEPDVDFYQGQGTPPEMGLQRSCSCQHLPRRRARSAASSRTRVS